MKNSLTLFAKTFFFFLGCLILQKVLLHGSFSIDAFEARIQFETSLIIATLFAISDFAFRTYFSNRYGSSGTDLIAIKKGRWQQFESNPVTLFGDNTLRFQRTLTGYSSKLPFTIFSLNDRVLLDVVRETDEEVLVKLSVKTFSAFRLTDFGHTLKVFYLLKRGLLQAG